MCQCVAVCCSMLQCVTVRADNRAAALFAAGLPLELCVLFQSAAVRCRVMQYVAICRSVLQCLAMSRSEFTACCSTPAMNIYTYIHICIHICTYI